MVGVWEEEELEVEEDEEELKAVKENDSSSSRVNQGKEAETRKLPAASLFSKKKKVSWSLMNILQVIENFLIFLLVDN